MDKKSWILHNQKCALKGISEANLGEMKHNNEDLFWPLLYVIKKKNDFFTFFLADHSLILNLIGL